MRALLSEVCCGAESPIVASASVVNSSVAKSKLCIALGKEVTPFSGSIHRNRRTRGHFSRAAIILPHAANLGLSCLQAIGRGEDTDLAGLPRMDADDDQGQTVECFPLV